MSLIRRGSRSLITTSGSCTPSETMDPKTLYGTVPGHRSYIFLHSTTPPSTFPARVSTPIQRALQLKAAQWGGLVNFVWSNFRPQVPPQSDGDSTSATAFSCLGGRLEIPEVTMGNLDDVATRLKQHADGEILESSAEEVHLYVCTHGARDCRCGDIGGDVVRSIRNEITRRLELDPSEPVSRVRVGEVGHVGGHQYAANLLVFPHGEWFGLLKPPDVPALLSEILATNCRPLERTTPPLFPHHWRGRMGLSKDEQVALFNSLPRSLSGSGI